MALAHVVVAGDCISTVAAQYGFFDWHKVWDHPRNADLKERRKNPNVLLPGDEIFIPDPEIVEHSRATDATHRFRVHVPLAWLRLQLCDNLGRPYEGATYTLEVRVREGGAPVATKQGSTTSTGRIDLQVPVTARVGLVTLVPKGRKPEEAMRWQLQLGHLDPKEESSGAEARLANLGLSTSGGREGGTRWSKAIQCAFQKSQGLTVTGDLDEATRLALADLHDKETSA
jgi:hypothetical protein